MVLWILYNSRLFENKSLSPHLMAEAAIREGFNTRIYYHDKFSLVNENNIQKLFYEGKKVSDLPDIVFCRGYNNELLQYFERNGCVVINTAKGMNTVINKFQTHLEVSKIENVKQPKTILGNDDYNFIIEKLNVPFIMKDNFGGKGEKVFLVNSQDDFINIKNLNPDTVFIYQEYIASSKGRDIRCYIIGDEIYPIMRHAGNEEEFRSNISQGGYAESLQLSQEALKMVKNIAKTLSIEIGSVDFLIGKNGELIFCEANGNAAFKSYTKLNIDLRAKFFNFIKNKYGFYKNIVSSKRKPNN